MEFKRGDICFCELYGVGSVEKNNRPCVVISNNKANKYSPVITVAPITSRIKQNLPTHVIINLNVVSCILLEQITTIDKSQIVEIIDHCDDNMMDKIEDAMMVQLAIENKAVLQENRKLKKQLLQYEKLLLEYSFLDEEEKEKIKLHCLNI